MIWLWGPSAVAALVAARITGLVWTAPAFATPGLDWRTRLGLTALLSAVLVPLLGPEVVPPSGAAELARALLVEILIGASLGWSAGLIVAGARQAGELVGAQAGLSVAALLDPEAGDELTPLGHLYGLVALATFLALDGPLVLIRALVESYRVAPAGAGFVSAETASRAFGRVGQGLALALRAAAPPALALALAGVALGLLGRAAASLQLVALSLPVRSALGLVLVLLGMVTLATTLSAAWGGWPGGG